MIADRDLHEAMASLEKIKPTGQPEADKRMVDYLTSLTKGANPKIPEVMALAQLQAFQKAMSQKPTVAPPQGTIRDKAVQSAGIMALQGAQQNQQNPNVIPKGISQPQMQAQAPANEEMPTEATQQAVMAARGGLMQAKVDPRMFEFTHGGIVSFSGEDQSYVDLDRIRAEAEEASNKLRTYGLRQRKEDPEGYDEAVRRAEAAKAAIRAKEREITGGPAGAMRQPMGAGPAPSAPVIPQTPDRPPTSTDEINALIGVPPAGGSAPPPPLPPPAAGGPSAGGQRPAGSTGIAQALPPELEAMRPKDNPDYQRMLEQSKGVADAYGRTVETQRTKAERPLIDSARELQETRKQLGIGDYANTLEKNRAEEKQEYEAAKKKREDKELNAMLNAMFKPGFKRGDISLARQEKLKEFEEADKTFTAAQRQSLAEISKYKESLAMGDLKEASDAKKEAEKGLITMAGKLAELKLGTFEQAIAYLKHGDNKTMEFNKAVLGFKTHQQDMAQRYSAQRDALKERIKQNQRAYDLRKEQLAFQYAKADVGANKKVLDELASRERMLEVQRGVAMNKGELEKADKFQDQLDELQSKRANILAPIAGRSEALQGGIATAPGATASQGKPPPGTIVTRAPS
jgi:hypothetical protein